MKLRFVAIVLIASVASYANAQQSTVYLCTDAKGNKEYTNTPTSKGCKKMALPGLTTMQMPKKTSANGTNSNKTETPASFPKVNEQTQRSRDSDRKQILQDELKAEEQKLANIKSEYKAGEPDRLGGEKNQAVYQERTAKIKEDLDRSEKNVEALKREIANLK